MLAGMLDRFVYLKIGLATVLVFVGVKMLIAEWYKVPIWLSLLLITLTIGTSVVASLVKTRRVEAPTAEGTLQEEREGADSV
jgi:tellurite resistance protein TerC